MYVSTLPKDAADQQRVYVMDPMLATGNSCVKTLDILVDANISQEKIVVVCAFSVPEGISQIQQKYPQIKIITATIDKHLNPYGYIVPGCGDAGDRLYLY